MYNGVVRKHRGFFGAVSRQGTAFEFGASAVVQLVNSTPRPRDLLGTADRRGWDYVLNKKNLHIIFISLCLTLCTLTAILLSGCTDLFDLNSGANPGEEQVTADGDLADSSEEAAPNEADAGDAASAPDDASGSHGDSGDADDSGDSCTITMLDVGQGLCVLIESEGKYMLYDGGGRAHSSYVVSRLKNLGVSDISYLFASHYDEDHIAGLIGVLNALDVENAVIPGYEADSKIYDSFITAAENAGAVETAASGDTYLLGDARVDVLSAADQTDTSENDKSTVVKLTCGDFSCVITGDAGADTETRLVKSGEELDCDLCIVGHHGSSSSSTPKFVAAMSPDYAFIGVGDNKYGHPTKKTLDTLEKNDVEIYRTDTQGELQLEVEGGDCEISTERTASQAQNQVPGPAEDAGGSGAQGSGAGTDSQAATGSGADSGSAGGSGAGTAGAQTSGGSGQAASGQYVLNLSSWKFHLPECPSVKDMAEHNKAFSDSSREDLIEQGYKPCGRCHP